MAAAGAGLGRAYNPKVIVYVWLNDENTLRKAGARTEPYAIFAAMLARGAVPDDFDALVRASQRMTNRDEP